MLVSGVTRSRRILKDLARVLTTSNRDPNTGARLASKNWDIVYPSRTDKAGEKQVNSILLSSTDQTTYRAPWPYSPWVDTEPVAVYVNGALVSDTLYNVDYQRGAVTFLSPLAPADEVRADFTYVSEGFLEAFDAIEDRVILRTTTTPQPTDQTEEFSYEPDRTVSSITMYVEIRRDPFVINPDTGLPYYTNLDGVLVGTRENIYSIQFRVFDLLNDTGDGPKPPTYDESGRLLDAGAHTSEWAKFAWALDWQELRRDEIDQTPGSLDLTKGVILWPVDVATSDGDMPIYFWCSVDNDGFVLVAQGDPAVAGDASLVSFVYVGRLDPMEGGGIADIGGNFALTSCSSTVPAWVSAPPKTPPTIAEISYASTGGSLAGNTTYVYRLTYTTDGGESPPSDAAFIPVPQSPSPTNAVDVTIQLPQGARGWRLYRYSKAGTMSPDEARNVPLSSFKLLIESFDVSVSIFRDDGSYTLGSESPFPQGRPVPAVVRDAASGAIVSVRHPSTWGPNTATGVTDIAVYKSRAGAYWQRHTAAFQSASAFMTVARDGRQPSAWTGKYHVSPIYVAHPIEGWRGQLRGILAVLRHGIVNGDELVLNMGKPDEKRYRYFAINAPFSLFQSSPSENFGIALLKN